MWPTDWTLTLLVLGLVPIAVTGWRVWRRPIPEIFTLQTLGVFFVWIGYHLSPWIAYLTGGSLATFLLVPDQIDNGLRFSLLCTACFLVGHAGTVRRSTQEQSRLKSLTVSLPRIGPEVVLGLSIASLVLLLVTVGGPSQLLEARTARGAEQWVTSTTAGRFMQTAIVIEGTLNICLATAASLLLLRKTPKLYNRVLGIGGLLTASLQSVHGFSRGAGWVLFVLAFLLVLKNGKRSVPLVACLMLTGGGLGWIGLTGRGLTNPGLYNFANIAMRAPGALNDVVGAPTTAFDENPLDAMAAWTRRADWASWNDPGTHMALVFLWYLNPLPSQLVPLPAIGEDLTVVMGTVGSAGLTTPAFGELYFAFGEWGCLFMLFLGWAYGWFDSHLTRNLRAVDVVIHILLIISFPVGLHQGVRGMTRPLVYAIVIQAAGSLASGQRRSNKPHGGRRTYPLVERGAHRLP